MPQVIRNKAFETNSSSCHSITIVGGKYINDCVSLKNENGELHIHAGEFGWEQEIYHDFNTKASYLVTDIMSALGEDSDRGRLLKKAISDITSIPVDKIKFVPLSEKHWNKPNEADWGYIDHQSIGVADDAFASEQTLKDYLFNHASYLETDNDNH